MNKSEKFCWSLHPTGGTLPILHGPRQRGLSREKFYRTLQLLTTKFLYSEPEEGEGEAGENAGTPVEAPAVVENENNEQQEADKELLNSLGLNADKFDMEKIKDARYVSDTGLDTGRPGDKKEDESKEEESKETYKINKEEFTRAQILEKITADFDTDFSKLTKEQADAKIKKYVGMENVVEGKKNVDRGNQQNAAEKKRLDKQSADFVEEVNSVKQKFEARENKLAEKEKFFADRLKKADKSIEDEDDEYAQNELRTQRVLDKDKLETIKEQQKDLSEEKKEAEKILKAKEAEQKQAHDDYMIGTMVDELQANFPELKTKREVVDVLLDIRSGKLVKDNDTLAARTVKKIINDYNTEYAGVKNRPDITKFYETFKELYPLPQRNGEKKEEKPVSEKLKEHKEVKSTEKATEQTKNYAPLPKSNLTPTPTGKAAMSRDEMLREIDHLH